MHLLREIELCGTVYMCWIYPFKRLMKFLKGYVRNQNHPKGSVFEFYIAKEAVEFCSEYIGNTKAIGVPKPRHNGSKGTGV